MFYLGIVLAVLGVVIIIVNIVLIHKIGEFFIPLLFFGIILIIVSWECLMPSPRAEDVFNGKADYVTYTKYGVTDDGDTISCEKTYSIEWKDEWKYGHKQK